MITKKKNIIFWVLFSFSFALYFIIKYLGPAAIEVIYNSGNLELLNRICSVESNQPLTAYIGFIQDKFLGPAEQIISGLLLTFFCLKYFLSSNKFVFCIIILAYLIITKFEVLFFPCYGEAGTAPVAEGIWLYKHSFDYVGLFHQNNFNFGGPKAYMFSIFPTYIALLLSAFQSSKAFILTYHFSMFVLASVIITLFRSILQKVYDQKIALLASILFLCLPLFQTLVELMNMEIMCLFFVTFCAYFLANKKILPASIMAVLASLAKGPGGIACGAVFVVSIMLFFFDPEHKHKIRNVIYGLIAVLVGAFKLYLLKTYVNPIQTTDRTIKFFIGWAPLSGSKFILFLYCLAAISIVIIFFMELFSKEKKEGTFFVRHYVMAIAFIFSTAWLGLYLNLSVMGPRYKLILAPFILLCGLFSINTFIKSKKTISSLLVIAIFLACLGSYGLYYKKKIESSTYSFNNLERTLEYRNDLKLDMLLAEVIKKDYSKFTVGAPFVIAQILAMPELGYVDTPLDVVIYGMSVYYAGIKNFSGLQSMNLPNTIWVGFANKPNKYGIEFPVDSKYDKVVNKLKVGDKELFLFQGGAGVHKMAARFYTMQMQKIDK